MGKRCVLVLVFCIALAGAAFGQFSDTMFTEPGILFPFVRVMGDIGFTYEMDGVRTVGTSYEEGSLVTETEFDPLYSFLGAGIGGIVQAGIDFEAFGLWERKGLFGGEAFAMGGYLNTGDSSQYLAGAGIGCTILWVGKFMIEIGYSGFLSPIPVPTGYTGFYSYTDRNAGGVFIGLDFGVEVPLMIVPNLYAFACYKYFTVYIGEQVAGSPHDQGYWLTRNSVCIGLSYALDTFLKIE